MDSREIIHYTITEDRSRFSQLNGILSQLNGILTKTPNANLDKPYHEKYSTEQSRISSFNGWPKTQKPCELAKVGFFYYGMSDIVKCFFCNGAINQWEENDVPIEEHIRWYPNCSYVRQLMGRDYLIKIREKYKNQDSGFDGDFSSEMTEYYRLNNQNSTTSDRFKERDISPTVVLARLDLPSIRNIMNLGFKESTVKRAIENKLRSDGDDFKNLVDLVNACFSIDENDKKLENRLRESFDLVLFNVPKNVDRFDISSIFLNKIHIRPRMIRLV